MRKALLGLLVVTAVVVVSCAPQSNSNNANANQSIAAGTTYVVAINLALKPGTDTYHFEVAPEEVRLKADADQVQWVVTNFTDLVLSDVTIDHFKGRATGGADPFRNGGKFSYAAVRAHSTEGGLKTGTARVPDTYDYQISATLTLKDGRKVPVTLDPRIVVSS